MLIENGKTGETVQSVVCLLPLKRKRRSYVPFTPFPRPEEAKDIVTWLGNHSGERMLEYEN